MLIKEQETCEGSQVKKNNYLAKENKPFVFPAKGPWVGEQDITWQIVFHRTQTLEYEWKWSASIGIPEYPLKTCCMLYCQLEYPFLTCCNFFIQRL